MSVRTEPQRPAGPPLQLSARPVSSTEVLVTWSPPLAELRHGEIQGYNVGENNYNINKFIFIGINKTDSRYYILQVIDQTVQFQHTTILVLYLVMVKMVQESCY